MVLCFPNHLKSHHAECTKAPISFAYSYTSITPSLTIKGTDSLKQQKCATSSVCDDQGRSQVPWDRCPPNWAARCLWYPLAPSYRHTYWPSKITLLFLVFVKKKWNSCTCLDISHADYNWTLFDFKVPPLCAPPALAVSSWPTEPAVGILAF